MTPDDFRKAQLDRQRQGRADPEGWTDLAVFWGALLWLLLCVLCMGILYPF